MRLTLRTLLAHLDRTLDAEDDAVISAKLGTSEFASQLVARVRASMASVDLDALSWEPTGRIDDPNRVAEYLDSVLSPAQIAEVERVCLESDSHLAEVAACHQVLTIVLGQSAEVPGTLRQRIYRLDPDRSFRDAVEDGIFGGGEATPPLPAGDQLTADAGLSVLPPPVAPVGVDDSGVWDAPARLKRYAATAAGEAAEARFGKSRRLSKTDLSDYRVGRSRWVPWVVGLGGLAALFIGLVWYGGSGGTSAVEDRLAAGDRVEARTPSDRSATGDIARLGDGAAELNGREPDVVLKGEVEEDVAELTEPPLSEELAEAADSPAVVAVVPPVQVDPALPITGAPAVDPESGEMAAEESRPPAVVAVEPTADLPPTPVESAAEAGRAGDVPGPVEAVDPVLVTGDGTLLLIRDAGVEDWMLGRQGDVIDPNGELICPPLYRDRLSLHGRSNLTLVGPARLEMSAPTGRVAEIRLVYGRFLISGSELPEQLTIRFGETSSVLTLPTPESGVAVEVTSLRPPGADPEDPAVTRSVIHVLAVGGEPRWRSGTRPEVTLEAGQLLRLSAGYQVSLDEVSSVPGWLDEPIEAPDSLAALARTGLLELVRGNESIELSLREAMDFRRAEVGALAARTLLLLGRHDVYFGAEGVFNQPRQRNSWPEHFDAMVRTINRGPETASEVSAAIGRMDGAQAALIYRLLWLYSDAQLEAGADETLVRALDDPNLTVRVLAAENLRRITGSLMNYRPEVDAAVRRATDIRRWEIRLRRGEIRWANEPGRAESVIETDQSGVRP